MSDIDKAREAYKLWWDTSPAPVPTACTTYIGALEAEITSLRSQLEEARALSNENKEWAQRMADDWAEFCEALSLEWGDQQHAVNQIVANFNKGAEEARENALEEAAKWHEEQAREISEIAEQNAHHFILCDKLKLSAGAHKQHAAAIRKLKEKP